MTGDTSGLLRGRGEDAHTRVTFVELFFDLVFVFAVTQLAHFLAAHLTPMGALHTALLLLAVWWAWIDTTWCTNWLDPDKVPVRLMLFVLMLAGLVLSSSIPKFESRALAFAFAYAFMQLGRSAFMLWALKGHSPGNYLNFQRIGAWQMVAAALWIAGAFADSGTRLALWALALLLETAAPAVGFWTPGLGRSTTEDWDVEGSHMAERCGLFIIIALGESILVTGSRFAGLEWTPVTVAAFGVSFTGSVAMWWIYFNIGAERASRRIASARDPGRLARFAYTYLHIPLVAGIILAAVGDELVLSHPTGHTDLKTAAVLAGGPALYLLGNFLFKRATTANRTALSHLVGLGLIVVLAPLALVVQPVTFLAAMTAVLVLVAVWETLSLGTRREDVKID